MTSGPSGPRHAPPWLFGITYIPFGIVGGFVATTMPFVTRKAGISVESIGWFNLLTFIPPILQFLYAPVVDLGPRRKIWLVIVAMLSAICLALAFSVPLPSQLGLFLALVVAAQMLSGLIGSCNGGLLATTLPNELRGRASGWINAGNLGGGALASWVSLYMLDKNYDPSVIGMVTAGMMMIPALAALTIDEAPRESRPARELFGGVARGVWSVARKREGWTGILMLMSPVGTAALINFFAGLSDDYHASTGMVAFVNGPMNGLLTAGGSLLGGWACDHMNRRAAYLISGGLTALCGLAMMIAPLQPMTYAVGVCAYLFISGLCYASFSAVVLEAVGTSTGEAASTQYTLFTSAGNAAIAYTGFLDTRAHKLYGAKSLFAVDGGLNLAGIMVLSLLFFVILRKRPVSDESAARARAA